MKLWGLPERLGLFATKILGIEAKYGSLQSRRASGGARFLSRTMIASPCIVAATIIFFVRPYLATANTEIINFAAAEHIPFDIDDASWNIPLFNASHNEQAFKVQPAPLFTPLKSVCEEPASRSRPTVKPGKWKKSSTVPIPELPACPHELWAILDLDSLEWRDFPRFTLRVSWPAFHPADFDIKLYNSSEFASFLHHPASQTTQDPRRTRKMYARIRLVDTGVPTPSFPSSETASASSSPVPFMLILEPLYLGMVPESVLPTLALLVPVVICTLLLVPYINRYLEGVATNAKRQLHKGKKTS